jgi:hypothetical protein
MGKVLSISSDLKAARISALLVLAARTASERLTFFLFFPTT